MGLLKKDIVKLIPPIAALILVGCAHGIEISHSEASKLLRPKIIDDIAAVRKEKLNKLAQANEELRVALRQHRILQAHQYAYIWPVKDGDLTSKYGRRWGRHHDGIDIAAPSGSGVRAAKAGKVIYSGSGLRGYGNMIVLNHGGGFRTVYAHNKKNLVTRGDYVRQGQMIALIGSTGRSSGPHVHFEVRQGSRPYNPLHFLSDAPKPKTIAKRSSRTKNN